MAGSKTLIEDARVELAAAGVIEAIQRRNDAVIFDWLMQRVSFQGISDAVAQGFIDQHERISAADISEALTPAPSCPKLRGYHTLVECGYRKWSNTCNEPQHKSGCPLPLHDLRNGRLNQTAYSLWLFMRDVCLGDFVGWMDFQLRRNGPGSSSGLPSVLQSQIVGPLSHVYGIGPKVVNMAMADFLLAGDAERPAWIAAGSNTIAIDGLVHNFLARTGVLHAMGREHGYGEGCYRIGGCALLIERLARLVDARRYNEEFPKFFPRFLQFAIWRFCASDELDICNGRRIDDTRRCKRRDCDLHDLCARRRLHRRLTRRTGPSELR